MLFRNLILFITIPFYLSGCATMTGADSKSSILYPDPATMSTAAICYRLDNAVLASSYRHTLWRNEVKKRGAVCTGGYNYYQTSYNNSSSISAADEIKMRTAYSQKASNDRGETCIKYDKQYWSCDELIAEKGYEYRLEWENESCTYMCFEEKINNTWYSEEKDELKKPGGPPKN